MNLKYEAARLLGVQLAATVPALSNHVHVIHADLEDDALFPCLAILPGRFRFIPQQDLERDDTEDDSVVVEAGTLEGSFELRSYATYPVERETIEEQVLAAFVANEGRAGTIVVTLANVTVGGIATTYDVRIACRLGDTTWDEEMVFSHKRYLFTAIDVSLPVLSRRNGVYTDETLCLAFTEDLESENPTPLEEILINEDGTISPAP